MAVALKKLQRNYLSLFYLLDRLQKGKNRSEFDISCSKTEEFLTFKKSHFCQHRSAGVPTDTDKTRDRFIGPGDS
jgi:hypothetical protein